MIFCEQKKKDLYYEQVKTKRLDLIMFQETDIN